MVENIFVKICPQCGSTDTSIPPAGLDIRMTTSDYCRACHNRGIFPEIALSDIKKFQEDLKEVSQ